MALVNLWELNFIETFGVSLKSAGFNQLISFIRIERSVLSSFASSGGQVVPKNSRTEKRFASPSASHFFPNGARQDNLTSVERA